jgi:DNA-binding transcriptional MerR regulator
MDKSPDAFRTISVVAEDLELPQHVLRFWETRFTQIRPLKRGGGRRYYRPDDIDLLKGIRHFLYGEGYTIRGVQRILKAEGIRFVQAVGRGEEDGQAASAMRSEADSEDFPEAQMGGRDAGAEIEPSAAGLDGSDLQRLRVALDELMECDRVLTALRAPDPVGE